MRAGRRRQQHGLTSQAPVCPGKYGPAWGKPANGSSIARAVTFGAAILFASAMGGEALAQYYPPSGGSQASQLCARLESQLALIDRGGPGQNEQTRQYEQAYNEQQYQLDRLLARSRRLGCGNVGIFSLFVNEPGACRPLKARIQNMRARMNQTQMELQRLQGGGMEGQRQTIIAALAQNNCGRQYQAAASRQRGLFGFGGLFGRGTTIMPMPGGYQSSTFRTLCVRTCDGYYFPISFQTTPSRFLEDEQKCRQLCPATEVVLYTHRNPGEDIAQAVSTSGWAYRDLPTAFRYREKLKANCSCRAPGQSWAEALGVGYNTMVPSTAIRRDPIQANPLKPDTDSAEPEPPPSGPVRSVGPTFVPAR